MIVAMSAPQPGYKRCPDCAEDVRAEARRCRFCGYSFEARQSRPWYAFLRRPGPTPTIGELLASWGAELAAGEEPEDLVYCRLGETSGYVALTSRRVMFFSARHPRCLLDVERAELAAAVRPARLGRSALELRAPGTSVELTGFTSSGALAELARRLGAAAA
jgi:hypothetical protein